MAEIIISHLKDKFISLVKSSKRRIILSSQFIKKDVLEEVLKNISSDIDIEILTSSNLSNYLIGASDIEALEKLIARGIKIRTIQNFNNKLYFFDDQVLMAPITFNEHAFINKNEFGVLFNKEDDIQKFIKQYHRMLRNNASRKLTKQDITTIKKCYKKLSRKCDYIYDLEGDIILRIQNIQDIIQEISAPWQKAVLLYINKYIKNKYFDLQSIYQGQEFFKTLYPNNHNIDARIRRSLQELRDYGLIKFYGDGNYKLLWEIKH